MTTPSYQQEDDSNPLDPWHFHRDSPPESVPLDLLPRLAELASSQDENEVRQGVLLIRKLLEVERNPPIQAVVEAGVCERLVACMQHPDSELQLDASHALSSVAVGGVFYARYVINLGAVTIWIQHLSTSDDNGREPAVLGLGNIAGGGAKHRDCILEAGALPALLSIILTCPPENLSLLRAAVKAVAALCRFKPLPALNHIAPAVTILALAIQHPDIEITSDSLWALANICDGPQDRVQLVIDSGVVPLIVRILDSPNETFHRPALRIIGNICCGIDRQVQVAIDAGCLRSLPQHLTPHRSRDVRKEALFIISNICASNPARIQAVIEAGFLPAVVSAISAPESEARKEALEPCRNLAENGTPGQIKRLVEAGALEALCGALGTDTDMRVITVALECICTIVESGAELMSQGDHDTNIYVDRIRSYQGETAITRFLSHSADNIRAVTQDIIDNYFEE